jgi:hypothetical protein
VIVADASVIVDLVLLAEVAARTVEVVVPPGVPPAP